MKYFVYIDESGSLNSHNLSFFSVTLAIISEDKHKIVKNFIKREIIKTKKSLNWPLNSELKAHDLKLANKIELIERLKSNFLVHGNFICSYIDNLEIKSKWLNDKNATYNFMIRCGIERAIDQKIFNINDELEIVADQREISTNLQFATDYYLKTIFTLEKEIFSIINLKYEHSHLSWGVQLADYISFLNFQKINKKCINGDTRFRKIY